MLNKAVLKKTFKSPTQQYFHCLSAGIKLSKLLHPLLSPSHLKLKTFYCHIIILRFLLLQCNIKAKLKIVTGTDCRML